MSLARLVYYSMVAGGWAAFFGCLLAELLIFGSGFSDGILGAVLVSGIIGGALGGGLSIATGTSGTLSSRLLRIAQGLAVGTVGGFVGGLIGSVMYSFGLPRALGWLVVGVGIGIADGIFERSIRRIRNGLIGGALGGLIGGALFDPVSKLVVSASGMSGRALSFTILGLCIGAMIGLAKVVLRDAWLTVVDGYRPGRQMILGQGLTILGRAEYLPLAFLGATSQEVAPEHACISMQPNGHYEIIDNNTTLGTRVNDQDVRDPLVLRDGDKIRIGSNIIRFNERKRNSGATLATIVTVKSESQKSPPPPVKAPTKTLPTRNPAEKPTTTVAKVAPPAASNNGPESTPLKSGTPPVKSESPPATSVPKRGPPPPPKKANN